MTEQPSPHEGCDRRIAVLETRLTEAEQLLHRVDEECLHTAPLSLLDAVAEFLTGGDE